MAVLLVTYEYEGLGPKNDRVEKIISEYRHIRLSRGSFAIETDEKTRTVFNKMIPHLGDNVPLLVVTLIKPFSGPVSGTVSDWLTKHLTEY